MTKPPYFTLLLPHRFKSSDPRKRLELRHRHPFLTFGLTAGVLGMPPLRIYREVDRVENDLQSSASIFLRDLISVRM